MRLGWLLAALAVIVVALVSVVAVYNIMQDNEAQYYSPMKDGIIAFIASNHPDAVGFLTNLDLKYLGSGVFSGGGWFIEIECVGRNCTAYADFSIAQLQNSSGIPDRILWSGIISNGTTTETSYIHAV
jgi:hypothetical protein